MHSVIASQSRTRVVIIGAGFAGLTAAKALKNAPVEVVVIDRHGLKRIDDATYLRRRILLAFEKAETEPDEDERRRLLNFVIVGAGPTGVEMAGAIAELARKALAGGGATRLAVF
jgi:NADH dehydrogenase FAD-containing subunit